MAFDGRHLHVVCLATVEDTAVEGGIAVECGAFGGGGTPRGEARSLNLCQQIVV